MFKALIDKLSKIPNLKISENVLMKNHTTFKIGGPAKLFLEVSSVQPIWELLKILKQNDITPLILGNGSNLLFPDEGYNGVILKISCNRISLEISSNNETANVEKVYLDYYDN